jgi:hypothetical protein
MQPIKHQLNLSSISKLYQTVSREYLQEPFIYGNFIDYYGCNDIEKSLYYLMDKKIDFPNWNADKFKVYESKNSFGI